MTRSSAYALGYKIVYQFEPTELCPTIESLEIAHKTHMEDFPNEESENRFAYLCGKDDGAQAIKIYNRSIYLFTKFDTEGNPVAQTLPAPEDL